MRTYIFSIQITISVYTEVKADSLGEAIAEAKDRSVQGLCHQCARGDPQDWNTSGGLDGELYGEPLLGLSIDGEDVKLTKAIQKKWRG